MLSEVILKSLAINNFKNIAEARLEFSPKINCFLGDNGMGKSNLLDAIHYLSFCKSFTGLPDSALMLRGADFVTLRGIYRRRGSDEELTFGLMPGKKKSFKRKGKEYERLSTHIGAFPLVLIAPGDQELVAGAPEERRRFMDVVISQTDPQYLDHLIRYGHALQSRNKLLRDHAVDPGLYSAIELTLARSADYLTDARLRWVEQLTGIFTSIYPRIAASGEIPSLKLSSRMAATGRDLLSFFDETRRHDEIMGYTTIGPHRDDLDLRLCDMPVRRAASQGQCKTYTIALRLAQYEFLRRAVDMKPLLLLDDIFDKLDASRVERLIDMVSDDTFGQIFITDTNRDHLDTIMERNSSDHRSWTVSSGAFSPR